MRSCKSKDFEFDLLATPGSVRSCKSIQNMDAMEQASKNQLKGGRKVIKTHLKDNGKARDQGFRNFGASQWQCPECPMIIEIHNRRSYYNYTDIGHHLKKFHRDVYLAQKEACKNAGYRNGAGLGFHRPNLCPFEEIQDDRIVDVAFCCAFCGMGVEKLPPGKSTQDNLFHLHFDGCQKRLKNMNYKAWLKESRQVSKALKNPHQQEATLKTILANKRRKVKKPKDTNLLMDNLARKRKAEAAKLGHHALTFIAKRSDGNSKMLVKRPIGCSVITFCKRCKLNKTTHPAEWAAQCAGKPVSKRQGIPPGDDWWRRLCRHNDVEYVLKAVQAKPSEAKLIKELIGTPTRRGLRNQLKDGKFAQSYKLNWFISRRAALAKKNGHKVVTLKAKRSDATGCYLKMPLAWSHVTFCLICRLSWPTHCDVWCKKCKGKPVSRSKGIPPGDGWWINLCKRNGAEFILRSTQASDDEKKAIRNLMRRRKAAADLAAQANHA